MSIIHRSSTDNRDVEFGTNISNRASYGSNSEDSGLGDEVKDNVSEARVSKDGVERKESRAPRKEDPFGDEEDSDVKYRTMTWRGIIVIIGLGMAATYTGYVIGQFKAQYPHVHNMADAGEVLLGVIGREVFGVAQIIFLVFIMGSHILTFSIMLNVLSNHGACTILFAVIGMIVSIIFSLPRTLKNVSYFSIACEY
ncbi:MAG: hypothetical protein M1813_009606 [Trichoglossum hirsutum]|nr:MAG: hypothetical protein M1813_009606 [Trichoglossum hirsutum]